MTNLPFLAHGVTLSMACFLVLNVLACAVVGAWLPSLVRRGDVRTPSFWLWLRLFPAVGSALFVVIIFAPSYWAYEPRELVEGFDVSLTMLAIAGVVVVAAAAGRGALALLRAASKVDRLMNRARETSFAGVAVPAFEVDTDQPMIALSGVFRPRLLVTRGLLATLSESELAAAVAHELRHQRALDNLKRLAMRAAPDVFARTAAARTMERRWASAAEHVADGLDNAAARCALASALVKVARLIPPTTTIAEPISTLIAGSDIASRVQCLLEEREPSGRLRTAAARLGVTALAASAVIAFAVVYSPILRIVHEATEIIVRTVP